MLGHMGALCPEHRHPPLESATYFGYNVRIQIYRNLFEPLLPPVSRRRLTEGFKF